MQPVKIQSRIDAGRKIAERLFGLKLDLFGESGSQDIAVSAVPRGGIIIGNLVASELAARLDVVVFKVVSWTLDYCNYVLIQRWPTCIGFWKIPFNLCISDLQ
jgi:hypothetical protein